MADDSPIVPWPIIATARINWSKLIDPWICFQEIMTKRKSIFYENFLIFCIKCSENPFSKVLWLPIWKKFFININEFSFDILKMFKIYRLYILRSNLRDNFPVGQVFINPLCHVTISSYVKNVWLLNFVMWVGVGPLCLTWLTISQFTSGQNWTIF